MEKKEQQLVFVVNGAEITEDELRKQIVEATTKPKKKTDRPSAHKGWRVVGHTAQELDAAKRKAASQGERFDEDAWRRNAKKRPVHPRPFMVPEAAEWFSQLAPRYGFIDLEIVELSTGEAS